MNKIAHMSMLIDFYGKLLTPKQYEIIDMYYNNDYSLSEISENLNISRQGVYDGLKRSQNVLNSFEEKLNLVQKHYHKGKSFNQIIKKLEQINNNLTDNELQKELCDVISELHYLYYNETE